MSPTDIDNELQAGGRSARLSFAELEAGVQAAEDALAAGHYRAALNGYTGLLQARLADDGTRGFGSADLIVIERLAELATLFGLFTAADNLIEAMVVLSQEAGNGLAADYAHMKRVELALARGHVFESFSLLGELSDRIGALETLDLSPRGLMRWEATMEWSRFAAPDRAILLTRTYLVMGQILAAMGKYGDALGVLARGLVHAEDNNAPDLAKRVVSPMRLMHAAALLERGDLDDAEAALAVLAAEPDDFLAPATVTRRLELAGKLDMLRGRLGSATGHFESVILFCRERGFTRARAAAALNLAHVLVLLNRVGDALRLVAEARHDAVALCDQGLELRAAAITSLARARRHSPAAAVSIALSVKEMVRGHRPRGDRTEGTALPPPPPIPQADNFLAFFEDRTLEFQWALGTDPDDAAARLKAIRETFGESDSRLIHARLPALDGFLAFAREDFATAAPLLDAAAREFTALSLKPELWQVLHLRARCLDRLGRGKDATRLGEAAENLLLEIAGSLGGGDRAIFLLNKATVEEDYIATQLDALLREQQEASSGFGPFRLRGRIRLMRRLHGLMEHLDSYKAALADRQLSGKRSGPASQGVSRHAGRRSVLRRFVGMPRDRALVSFLVLPDRLLVIWSSFLTLGFAVSPITRIDLRERVRRWHELMQRFAYGPGRDLALEDEPTLSTEMQSDGERIIADLAEALQIDTVLAALPKQVRALSIVPDDVLNGVPFAALKHEGRYLIEKFALSIGFTTRPATRRRAGSKSALVVGVSRGLDNLSELPKVGEEVHSVAAWLSDRGLDVRSLVDDDASRGAVLDGLRGAALAHIACHGTFEPDRPDHSGIILIPEPRCQERLTLRDLSSLRLEDCRHVTLSSCWSADNFILPGRWIISLPETLWRSGAESALGSLWPVDDDVAGAFMSRFYTSLERLPRSDALREAQLAALANELGCRRTRDGKPIDTSVTFFWAGFALYGEAGRLTL